METALFLSGPKNDGKKEIKISGKLIHGNKYGQQQLFSPHSLGARAIIVSKHYIIRVQETTYNKNLKWRRKMQRKNENIVHSGIIRYFGWPDKAF